MPLIKAAILHEGFALLDVISPCVTFNDHEGSTKSYLHTREFEQTAVYADFVPIRDEITANIDTNITPVTLHDGSQIHLRTVDPDYDPSDRGSVVSYIRQHQDKGQIVTGLLFVDEAVPDMLTLNGTTKTPLVDLSFDVLNPGAAALSDLQKRWR